MRKIALFLALALFLACPAVSEEQSSLFESWNPYYE